MTIKDLSQTIKDGNIDDIKKLKKEIDKIDIKGNKKEWQEFIKETMQEFRKAENVKLQIAINSTLNFPLAFHFGSEMKEYYSDFVLENLLHNNGQIRQQSVKMGSNFLRDIIGFDKNKQRVDYLVIFIKKLLDLIDDYEKIDQKDIERERPCRYKSLMLLLEDSIFPDYVKDIARKAKILKKIDRKINNFYREYYSEDNGMDDDYSIPIKKEDAYYDAMDMLCEDRWESAEGILRQTLKKHKDYIELYVGLASVYRYIGDDDNFEKIVEKGYKKLREKFPEWPKEMFWGYTNNRQFLRMIDFRASLYFDQGDKKEAEKLYKLLLRFNPGDNQGIRYFLAGLYEDISSKKMDEILEEENLTQDRSKTEDLLKRQNKIHNFF